MAYASVKDIEARLSRPLNEDEENICAAHLEDAAVIIDCFNENAANEKKRIVSCRMVIREIGDADNAMPIGATQGSVSALGYSQSWTLGAGSTGELYLSKLDKKILGVGDSIGSHSPLEDLK